MSGGESQELAVDDGKRTPSNCACCWRALVDGETETCRECGGVCCDGCCFLGLCDDCSVDEDDDEDWDEDDDLDEDDIEDEDEDFDDLEDDGDLDDEPSDGFGEDDDF